MTAGARHDGPLPALFLALAFTTGMLDATSFLDLGSVFVAAMTGNVVILGLGLAGYGASLSPAVSLACFAAGAGCAGLLARSALRPVHRGLRFAAGIAVQGVLVGVVAAVTTRHGFAGPWPRDAVVGGLAFSLGWQYATVRGLRVSDVNTTVVTTTLTSLFAESVAPARQGRRLLSICALLAGACSSGLLRRAVDPTAPLWTATALIAACVVAALAASVRRDSLRWR
ncbi:YoaK family protein [Actinocorallia sp. A-T 12471]|uniref:YoaK family protein n=1 Tax=Actinocorallia sp. A-T 12471 TaxID=3089813 RepID=UPI0029D0482E|nr:YoaK family protein [Actinocorallia sp. A-T 12471]MDX6740426.1 YoaK family protein [Actinocorallia sp. A-T 12471]